MNAGNRYRLIKAKREQLEALEKIRLEESKEDGKVKPPVQSLVGTA